MTTNPTAAIVAGGDGSLQSMHAVDWATREAAARRCPYVDDAGSPAGSVSPNRSPGGDDECEQLRRP